MKQYIAHYKLKVGDYLLGQTTDKNKVIAEAEVEAAEPNFSNKLTQKFQKVYNVHTSLDFICKIV